MRNGRLDRVAPEDDAIVGEHRQDRLDLGRVDLEFDSVLHAVSPGSRG
jgi:hypothetical protein